MIRTPIAFVALLAFAPFLQAEDKPPVKERLNPDGIPGSLLLYGPTVPEAARDRFLDLAGKDKANIVILSSTDKAAREAAEKLAESWKASKAIVIVLTRDADPKILEALPKATGVWQVDGPSLTGAVEKEVQAVLARGGVVAMSGKAVSTLLPGAIVDASPQKSETDKRLVAALAKSPGQFGVGIGEGAALLVRGRVMTVLGNGTVTAYLAKTALAPQRTIEVTAKTPTDLTMLRRAAIARADASFPPKIAPVPEVPKGSLVIVGGGGMPADVTKKFIELAGGPDALIVVLPTANPDPLPLGGAGEGGFFKRAGAKNVISLPGRTLSAVDDPKTLEVLKRAGGVWFGGGRQWRFVDAYEGTKMEPEFRAVLERGGVIGGSSAGASIQGYYMCRGSPLGNLDIMCEGYERGLGFLPGVGIDQHFTQRKRFADMTSFVKTYPQLLGIGLDEATAIVVRGHVADVMGAGQAHFYDAKKPVEKDKADHESIKAGGKYDLKERKVMPSDKKQCSSLPLRGERAATKIRDVLVTQQSITQ
jgi:cyanophycinase